MDGNVIDLLTGGEPIKTDSNVDVVVDNSVYIAIALLIAGIILAILVYFMAKSLS